MREPQDLDLAQYERDRSKMPRLVLPVDAVNNIKHIADTFGKKNQTYDVPPEYQKLVDSVVQGVHDVAATFVQVVQTSQGLINEVIDKDRKTKEAIAQHAAYLRRERTIAEKVMTKFDNIRNEIKNELDGPGDSPDDSHK